jgi:hypothetical protein
MRVVISALLLILALHFLLESVTYRKYIDLSPAKENFDSKKKEEKEDKKEDKKEEYDNFCTKFKKTNYDVKKELVDYVNCKMPDVVGANSYPFDENDANFGSDVMNLNKFYKKNLEEEPALHEFAENNKDINSTSLLPPRPSAQNNINSDNDISYSLQPNTWKYYNEMAMNGGEILPGLTGYDSLTDQYTPFNNSSPVSGCEPPTRGATVNDDLRMGLGVTNSGRRGRS